MSSIFGIDVSSNNGEIEWEKVRQAGCGMAILRITRKNLAVDARFPGNLRGCKEYGIPYGVYRYVYESTQEEAEKAARAVVALLQTHKADSGTMVWWDVEDSTLRADADTTLTPSILAARQVIRESGYGFGVYCGLYWYQAVLQVGKLNCPFWIAAYGTNPVTDFGAQPARKSPAIGHALWGWQYCSRGRVPGIRHDTDLDIVYGLANAQPVPTRTLQEGSRGEDVKWLQSRLNTEGAGLALDGIFGPLTRAAVIEYQLRHGLEPDGIVGPNTRGALLTP